MIGITCDVERPAPGREWLYQNREYFAAVAAAGGLPVLLPLLPTVLPPLQPPLQPHMLPQALAAAYLERVDGLLLSGGNDLDPAHWGEDPLAGLGRVEPARDTAELALATGALQAGVPVLGICRGAQVLAVAAGGTLWQDIPSQVPGALQHAQQAPRWHPSHAVAVAADSHLGRLLGPGPHRVNSFHHQAVRTLPQGWRLVATAPDGVVEAIEGPGPAMALGVQWHPECFCGHGDQHQALFAALVQAASNRRG